MGVSSSTTSPRRSIASACTPAGMPRPAPRLPEQPALVFRLVVEGVILGSIVDERQAPLTNVDAEFTEAGRETTRFVGLPLPGTNRFRLNGLRAGVYSLALRAPQHAKRIVPDIRLESGQTVDLGAIVLSDGLSIPVTVVDVAGTPIADARVFQSDERSQPAATTNTQGQAVVRGLPSGTNRLHAEHAAFLSSAPVDVTVTADGAPAARITLHKGGRIEGIARRRDGGGVKNAYVQRHGDDERAAVDHDGRFTLSHVPLGHGILLLMVRDGDWFRSVSISGVEVVDDEVQQIDMSLRDVTVSGTLTREGRPLADHRLDFERLPPLGLSFSHQAMQPPEPTRDPPFSRCTTDDQGRFELLVPFSGSYRVFVTDPAQRAETFTIDVPDAATARLDIPLATTAAPTK